MEWFTIDNVSFALGFVVGVVACYSVSDIVFPNDNVSN